ncbi:hypothetical protein D1822_10970 [Phaeobacter inhibens]|uniref:Uncharacterized protein n=1 Tax=Phaeobacter porticola TaxID=1844006 RepID=A0A1L3I0M5_9RHOB|nr:MULTISPECIES: hypothetical protein [Phaeobacter]APG45675.1 hypothetical protein PhaeoP97_00223 [Phaeobacter porticola]AUQ46611.1 hypothetical protein PhaeoP10_02281 [Phaeobacter inhibens]AUR04266.1 hypothetical protein PhaeoP72_02305 [Phaeobacter inhibens]AXT23301.1 hypothetical protein D1822_10970 [Phaeobacter inhibens]
MVIPKFRNIIDMHGFRERLSEAVKNSPYGDDIWGLSTAAGLGKKTLYNIINDKKLDISKTGPGLFGMSRVASLLGTTLDHLAGIAPPVRRLSTQLDSADQLLSHASATLIAQHSQSNGTPTIDSLMRTHLKSGGVLEGFTETLAYCDQYAPCAPDASSLEVIEVGAKSLAAITMGQPNARLLQTALDTVPDDELKRRWVSAYASTSINGPLVSLETLDVQMPNHPVRVKMEFIRGLFPVRSDTLGRRILNYSLLIV